MGKFVGIADGQIVVVADNWDELARRLMETVPDPTITLSLEVGADYDRPQMIWGITTRPEGGEGPSVDQIDRDFAVLAALCETSDPADEERMARAIREAKEMAKEQVRRQFATDSWAVPEGDL
jgi:hypothetical protein